jgi:menaquinone-dependent protoporphyrinogen oxidase
MKIAILYATREGQTRRIAEYLAGAFHARDVPADVFNLKQAGDPDLESYDALVVAGSVHLGKHEPELVKFVKHHRDELQAIPSAFISVSMSQAGIESVDRSAEQREAAKREIETVLERFYRATAWRPRWVLPVAGALLYTKYNFLVRFVMKQISKAAGSSTDTKHDHEYTDWAGLERFSARIIDELHPPEAQPPATL